VLSSRKILFDQLTPITIFAKLQSHFSGELCFLFESAINNNDGNFSFLFIGARERVIHKDGESIHIDEDGTSHNLGANPFTFLKKRYAELDKTLYKNYAKELGVGFVDGFIGYIGYDAVKIFEPRLKAHMDGLKDDLHIPEIDLMRPKLVCTFSHKSNTLTLTTFVSELASQLDTIEGILKEPHIHIPIQTAYVDKAKGSFAFSKEYFFEMVSKSKEMIRSGDVFQILMSNRFTQYTKIDRLSFYRILRQKNPSPYMFYLSYPEFAIIGSSPEVKHIRRWIFLT
jgi:anthranilate synthase component 1